MLCCRSVRRVLPARHPQRPAEEAGPASGGPGGGAAQDTGEAGQHRAVARVLLNTPDPHIFLQERNPVRVLQL